MKAREARGLRPAQGPASAQAPGPGPLSASGADPVASGFSQRLERGLKLYDERDYSAALHEFESAYEIQQLPRLLYNMARAHIQLGHAEDALGLYQKFLRLEPDAPDEIRQQAREDITRASGMIQAAERIRAMKERQAAPPGAAAESETAEPLPVLKREQEPAPIHKRWWFWTAIGGGAALLGGAVAGGVYGYRDTHPPLPVDQVPGGVPIFTIGL